MPDSLLAIRRGVGTRPSNGIKYNSNINENTEKYDNGLIPPSKFYQNENSKISIDFSARLGATIRGKLNKSK